MNDVIRQVSDTLVRWGNRRVTIAGGYWLYDRVIIQFNSNLESLESIGDLSPMKLQAELVNRKKTNYRSKRYISLPLGETGDMAIKNYVDDSASLVADLGTLIEAGYMLRILQDPRDGIITVTVDGDGLKCNKVLVLEVKSNHPTYAIASAVYKVVTLKALGSWEDDRGAEVWVE